MIGISSNSAGVLLLPKPGTGEYTVLDVVGGEEQDSVNAQYLYSTAQDWEEIEGSNTKALLDIATQEYWLERTVSLLRLTISGLESSLEKRVLEHVEEILGSRVSSEKVIDRLLVAPLSDQYSSVLIAQSALSKGFSAVASILEDLAELQPLLRRLTDLWLGLSETPFSDFTESKETIWTTVTEKCGMKQLLIARNKREFAAKWNLLVFHFPTPSSRSGVGILGKELSRRLFPNEEQEEVMTAPLTKGAKTTHRYEEERGISDYEIYERVKKQIIAIAEAVSQGNDNKAEKFLRELIHKQISPSGGESYAVKSLCNIAQRCADMFRTDFEAICLDEALRLHCSDPWTLIQYGDHLKRVGNYNDALKYFEKAEQLGESVVAKSSVADVYSQQGDYTKAIRTYEAIPNWRDRPAIRTAIADNLRRMGRIDESKAAYMELIDLAKQGLPEFVKSEARSHIGIAEVAKIQGKLEDALQTYRVILNRKDIENRDRLFYMLGICNVLKLLESYNEAYSIVDEVVQAYPFAMQARFIRGSILGLMGREQEGLLDLPESSGSRSWREWMRRYYRGLLLFKLERYGDAKKNLVEELSKAIACGEEKAIIRMAAALCFLREDKTLEVDKILSDIPTLHDCHAHYLYLVLKLHSATRKKDLAIMKSLKEQISGLQVENAGLEKAVVALCEGNFTLALTYETDALLKLAA